MDDGYNYNGKFKGNFLVVGQTGFGETKFIQNLAKNKMFRELKEILDHKNTAIYTKRKKYFFLFSKEVDFKYPQTVDYFSIHLTFFERKRHVDNDIDVVLEENNIFDELIVIDTQNPIVGPLLRELDIGKKDRASELTKKAPTPGIDLHIPKRVQVLRKRNKKLENNNN